ncbi:hypothetical protein [Streptomyces niveus]|uniref:hypothetical protein n=1 Tax=Streptomyces niveus TaxID=193462 RepID=UPI00343AE778
MADRWVKPALDIRTVDAARFEEYVGRCRRRAHRAHEVLEVRQDFAVLGRGGVRVSRITARSRGSSMSGMVR